MSEYKIGIIGYGDLGFQIEAFLLEAGIQEEDICVFDDNAVANSHLKSFPFNSFRMKSYSNLLFYLGLGYHHLGLKKNIIQELIDNDRQVPSFIHHTSYVHSTATIGPGVFIYPMCCIDQRVSIGRGTLLNNRVVISHDSKIGEACFIAPGAIICGKVSINEQCFIGAGANISNGVSVGRNCKVSIGATLSQNLRNDQSILVSKSKIIDRSLLLK